MRTWYGWTQQEIHPKSTKQIVGYLVPNDLIHEVMDEHNIVFQEVINVLFCMTPQERVATKFSQYDEL